MSQSPQLVSDLPEGNYQILSDILPPSQPIGVHDNKEESTPVRSNAPVWVWHIKPVPGEYHGYKLSLLNAYDYTGLDGNLVIATKEEDLNHIWHIYKVPDGKYIIAQWPRWPNRAWTAEANPGGDIKLYPESPEFIKPQLFTIKPAPSG